CGWPLILPDLLLGIYHRCFNCDHAFDTRAAPVLGRKGQKEGERVSAPPLTPPAAPPDATARRMGNVRLTLAHRCMHCDGDLPATGLRRSSITCPECKRATSVYAVHHRCPGCEAVLESPRSERGTYLRCPACGIHLTIPTDALYNDDREEPDHTWYAFPCPS